MVSYNGREVLITCSHMGVEPTILLLRLPTPSVVRRMRELQAELSGMDVFVSVPSLPPHHVTWHHLLTCLHGMWTSPP